jgi:hypothetical protein
VSVKHDGGRSDLKSVDTPSPLICRRAVAEFMFVLPADTLGTAFVGQRLGRVFPLWQIGVNVCLLCSSDHSLAIANNRTLTAALILDSMVVA